MAVMEEHELHIMTRTIQKIEFLDSIMGRGPMLTFGQIVSIPELENAILTWDFFEGAIHSKSYSWILQNCYSDPSAIFDEVHDIKELQNIANFISGYYNDFYTDVIEYQYLMSREQTPSSEFMLKLKTSLLTLLMTVNCLEGIEFLSSFSAMWALTEAKGLVSGNSKILQFIARDELQHLRLTQNMNRILRDEKSEGFSELWKEMSTKFYDIYLKTCELEFEWIDMLYSKGSIIGMNAEISKDYVKYSCNNRLKAIGLKPMYSEITKNPLPWIDRWYNFGSTSGALQEIEATDYKLGGIKFDNVNYKI
jgi:ribonucleoside-diphosphate reductase beta chain